MSCNVDKVYCAPGNAGTAGDAENSDIDISDHKRVIEFCREKSVDLVVVGPEAPLAVGIADELENAKIKVFGPTYAGARLESSKIFAKELMGEYGIPTAGFKIFDYIGNAAEYLQKARYPLVVKAYGLAAGKGVVIAGSEEEAVKAAEDMLVNKVFGSAGEQIIIEDFLEGEEASILTVTDGKNIIPLATSQDHKRANDGDTGPNTGGMGAYSPAPVITDELYDRIIREILVPTVKGLRKEGITYRGVLYAGVMITADGPKVLEYNVRFGDPETQVVLPRMKSDLAELLMAAASGDISSVEVEWDDRDYVCVVLASGGYPEKYEKGKKISGLDEALDSGALVFHAGTEEKNGDILTSGGRVLGVVGRGKGIEKAIESTYRGVEKIRFDGMQYRNDIGHRALAREK
jgi:phosphoribosylamine--glycine ligase